MKRINTFDGGIVDRPYKGWPDFYTCMNYKTGEVWNASTPAEAAKLAGFETYCIRESHKCEGKGCNKLSTTKYCPSCHFDPKKRKEGFEIGLLGM